MERQHGEEIDRRAHGEDDRVIAVCRVEHQPGRLGHDHPADAAHEAAKSDHRPDRAFGEHIGRDREERRRKGLMPGERETDQDDGQPHIVEPGDEQQRQDETTGDHHRQLAREIGGAPALDQLRGEPAARDTADVGEKVHDDHRQQHDLQVDIIGAGEIFGQPEQHQIPDGIDEEFRDRERPCLALGDDFRPAEARDLLGRIMLDPREFGIADLPALTRIAVEPQPQYQQESAKCAGVDEGLTPVEARPDHEQPDRRRGQNDPDRRRTVNPADRKSALFLGKPLARRADDRRKMPRLADAEDDTRGHERGNRPREPMGDMADRPDGDRNAVSDLGAEAVDQPAHVLCVD
eukprot:Opistho-1_new@81962